MRPPSPLRLAGVAAGGSPQRAEDEQPRWGVCQPPTSRGAVEKEESSGGCWPVSPRSGSPWSPQCPSAERPSGASGCQPGRRQ